MPTRFGYFGLNFAPLTASRVRVRVRLKVIVKVILAHAH